CLNCEQGPTPEPCGECASCRELGRGGGGSLDVVEIDAASHGGVDDTRDLREKAVFAPARDRYKVFVLDEAHMVSREGFNALLKIVEEPPPHVKFNFATTEPNKVLPTIRSRSHHYPFRLVPPGLMTSYMDKLSQSEGVEVAPGVMQMVVRAGGGSVRDTESVLDQLIGGSVDGRVSYERASSLLGFTPDELIGQMVSALDRADGASMFAVIESVVESGLEPHRFAEDLLERLRDLIVLAAAGPSARQALRGLPEDQVAGLAEQAARFGFARLTRAADSVSAGLAAMAGATSPRLHLELLAARALQAARAPQARISAPDAAPAAARAGSPSSPPAPPPTPSGPGDPRVHPAPGRGAAAAWSIPGVTTGAASAPAGQGGVGGEAPSRPEVGGSGAGPAAARQFVDWDEPEGLALPSRYRAPDRSEPGPGSGKPRAYPSPSRTDGPRQPSGPAGGAGPRPASSQPPGAAMPTSPRPDLAAPAAAQPRRESAAGQPRRPAPASPDAAPGAGEPWEQLLEQVRRRSATAFGLLSHSAQLAGVEPGQVTLAFATPDLAATFSRRFAALVEQAGAAVFGQPVKVTAIVGGQPAGGPPADAGGPGPADARRPAAPPPAQAAAPPPPVQAPAAPPPAQAPAAPPRVQAAAPPPPAQAAAPPEPPRPAPAGPGAAGRRTRPDAPDFDDDIEDEASPNDGDAGVRGLTGVPLVIEMLGGEIVDEVD
ncbi:MAG: DNA polymerase III subunit gamma/tau, partial [Bifidobacteriaceae bacterium]|nr:DNA polymerase III subunit gamma/tau [Bifidobacteriaceae bacterium]